MLGRLDRVCGLSGLLGGGWVVGRGRRGSVGVWLFGECGWVGFGLVWAGLVVLGAMVRKWVLVAREVDGFVRL